MHIIKGFIQINSHIIREQTYMIEPQKVLVQKSTHKQRWTKSKNQNKNTLQKRLESKWQSVQHRRKPREKHFY